MNRYKEFDEMRKKWRPPRELGHSAPRDVQLSAGGVFVTVVAAVLVLGALASAVLLGRKSASESADRRLLQERGSEGQARIVRLWRSKGEDQQCHVRYQFEAGGDSVTGETKVRCSAWKKLAVGERIPVRYLPSRPAVNHLIGWGSRALPVWVVILPPTFCLAAAALIVFSLRRQAGILADGRPAPAVVTRVRKVGHSHGGSSTVIHYEFPLLGGGIARGKCSSHRKGMTEGARLCVLYDPDDPRRKALYPLDLVRIAK